MRSRLTTGLTTAALLAVLALHPAPTHAEAPMVAPPPPPVPVLSPDPGGLMRVTDPQVLQQLLRLEVQLQQLIELLQPRQPVPVPPDKPAQR